MQHDPQKFRKPDGRPFTIFWFSSTLSPAAQSGLACNCHWGWSPVLLKLLTCCNNNNNNIFHHLCRRHWPLRASGVIGVIAWPDHGQVAIGGGADQGFVRREMRNFFGFDRNYFRLQYCRAFFREGVWFSPKKQDTFQILIAWDLQYHCSQKYFVSIANENMKVANSL